MNPRFARLFFITTAYTMLWSVTLLILLEDDAAMLAFMLS